jgi:YidC/Oxa1 family membrane protein insertase
MDLFVYPMAGIMWVIGKTIGFGSYPVTIIIATIVVRTIAWPIYGKTNDMQLKMQLVQPEMEKIQKKYAGREDQESKQRMSMETMQLYKKYGIGFGGCLMPFVQMPILRNTINTALIQPLRPHTSGIDSTSSYLTPYQLLPTSNWFPCKAKGT